jgi:hypothetical protein
MVARAGKPGLVIGAPHGTSDDQTDRMGHELAERTGFGLVVATGFSHLDAEGRRFSVNRPTEGVPGRAPSSEVCTEEARRLYETYAERVKGTAQGPVRLLVELHGNIRRESAGLIEIATVGVDRPEASRLKRLLALARDAHAAMSPGTPRLEILVEPLDQVYFGATGAKRAGILRIPERALHIELPTAARTSWREPYVAILADFLAEASALLPPW